MVNCKRIQPKLLGFLFTLILSITVTGQTDRGAISGTVVDQNGAAIRQARVKVVNLDSGASREMTTTEDGTFFVPELRAAPYKLTVEAQGFKTTTIDRIQIAVQVTRRVDVKLEVGAVGEVTTITANAGALQTESPVLQTNITDSGIVDYLIANALSRLSPEDSKKIEFHLLRAIRLEPSFAPARLSLAKLQLRTNRLNEARTELERVIALNANLAEAHYQLGLVYSRLKKMDEARASMARFKQLSESEKEQDMKERKEIVERLAKTRF